MMIKHAITPIILLINIGTSEGHHQPNLKPTRPAQVIYIPEDYNHPFIAEPGDRVIVIMNNDSEELDELNRCEDWGGELIYNPFTDILTCEDIDF